MISILGTSGICECTPHSKRSADLRCVRSAAFRTRQRSPVRFTIASAPHHAQMDRMSRLRRPFLEDRRIFVTSEASVLIPSTVVLNEGTPLKPIPSCREDASFRPDDRMRAHKHNPNLSPGGKGGVLTPIRKLAAAVRTESLDSRPVRRGYRRNKMVRGRA